MGSWVGLDEVMARMTAMTDEAALQARVAVTGAAAIVERAAKANFQGSHAKGQPHEGGDLPNIVSGTLRRSIRTQPVTHVGLASYRTMVAPTTVYGRRIELGYPGGSGRGHQHTRAFPYFGRAVDSTHAEVGAFASSCWAKVGRG